MVRNLNINKSFPKGVRLYTSVRIVLPDAWSAPNASRKAFPATLFFVTCAIGTATRATPEAFTVVASVAMDFSNETAQSRLLPSASWASAASAAPELN